MESTTSCNSDSSGGEAAPFAGYVPLMNASIASIVQPALRLSVRIPSMARTLLRLARISRSAAQRRAQLGGEGVTVPPVLIMSVTHRCNLRCKGCYAAMHTWGASSEMNDAAMDAILSEAEGLGIVFCILAGGEPLVRKGILDITARHTGMVFPLFTNGLLISEGVVRTLASQRHVVPILSIEGTKRDTDDRRGTGVHESVFSSMDALSREGIPFGVSITVDTNNLDTVCDDALMGDLYKRGARIFYFIEYVAMDGATSSKELSITARQRLLDFIEAAKHSRTGIYIAFPGNEARYGGCLSSGRGFVHINPSGGLEPCPAAPFTDINVAASSLREVLMWPMPATIRVNHAPLDESGGGCALWRNRHVVEKLLGKATTYECTGEL